MLPKERWISTTNLKLHYLDWGNAAAMPLVLLHGLCSYAHYWDFFAPAVTGDYHVVAFDQRGHGESGWAASYGLNDYVADLELAVDELELDEFVLVGHSLGGIISIIYAAQHPDRVSRLIIVDIAPDIDPDGIRRMETERQNQPPGFDSEEAAFDYFRQLEPRQSDVFIRHCIKYGLKRGGTGRLINKCAPALLKTELRSPQWLWQYLEGIICPTLVIHAVESDMLLPEVAQRMAEVLPLGRVVDVDGAAHLVPSDNPDGFQSAVRQFLRAEDRD